MDNLGDLDEPDKDHDISPSTDSHGEETVDSDDGMSDEGENIETTGTTQDGSAPAAGTTNGRYVRRIISHR